MNQLKKISISIMGILLFYIIIDSVVGVICHTLVNNAKYGIYLRQNYVLKESNDDIIIIGSSRAAHHYIPSIISDSIGATCFNAGYDGQCIFYHYGVISALLDRGHRPKFVIYDVLNLDIQESNRGTFTLEAALNAFSPYYSNYPAIDSLFYMKGKFERYKLYSQSYRYNSQLTKLLTSQFIPENNKDGFSPLFGEGDWEDKNENYDCAPIDKLKLEYFIKLINKLKKNNVPLLLVFSPRYDNPGSLGINKIKQISEEYNLDFWDFSQDVISKKKEYFKDPMHLNIDGATYFTKSLTLYLKDIIK